MEATEAKLQLELRTLQTRVSEEFSGIIWLTRENFSTELPYFFALDYLADGALQQLFDRKGDSSSNLVLTKSFGHSFFIAQFTTNEDLKKILSTTALLSQEEATHFPRILLLGVVPLEIEEQLKKAAPHLNFEILAS